MLATDKIRGVRVQVPCDCCGKGIIRHRDVTLGPVDVRLCGRCESRVVQFQEMLRRLDLEIHMSATARRDENGSG